ncbi:MULTISPECIES: pyridoxamine 5'-phosphate oxidase family protein [Flavobacteriaceae]|uniref:pyridoxamine 5'-phosphate oxidase family protein n=1 Tax=Flavobacteriaceae TaxID=49546 RepID=UPI0014931F61|nr:MULTISPECIES: pyridoxamine 5'-phosphate oxidase family protein [Allomuricauda]MDC6367737.1 pyridoxamine 5'-phosphate oxidase family protein [Muricauda sp. AC10]
MGSKLKGLNPSLINFIKKQQVFFVATAMEEGSVNLSPKGLDSLRVLDENRVIWLNLTGSGNETAVHLAHKNRITIMFCAFEGDPIILRLYGTAKVYPYKSELWKKYIDLFPEIAGSRQLVDVEVEMVQISCGMGVPLMDFKNHRNELVNWAEKQGETGLRKYWDKKNRVSLDGHPIDME